MSDQRIYQIGNSQLVLDGGSVLDIAADVVVSSDDYMLTMGGGVSAAIASAAGSALVLDAAKAVPAKAGDVIVTTAGALASRYVFHVVTIGPEDWRDPPGEDQIRALVRMATRKCLLLADALGVNSVVFPALGTGSAGFSVEASAAAMADVVSEVLPQIPAAMRVSIRLLARTLASPLHFVAFYEEFARRVPIVARNVVADAPTASPATSPVFSTAAELEQERQRLEQRLIEVRREQPASPVQQEIREAIERNTDARLAEAERERTTRTNPVMVFVSYARDDDKLRDRLHDHLGGLRGAGRIKDWYDGEIVPGANWAEDIQKHMDAAEIVLLLVSPAFLGSDFIQRVELTNALARHQRGELRVIPLIMQAAYWQGTALGELQALPQGAKPVTSWEDQDAAMADIASGVDRAVKDVIAART